jgi:two-component system, cell cycle sensor histidine kinase and response regulator CckA
VYARAGQEPMGCHASDRMVALVEGSASLIAFLSFGGELLYVNPAGRRVLGLGPGVEARLTDLLSDGDGEWERIILPEVLETGAWHGERRFRNVVTGTDVPMEMSALATHRGSRTPCEIVLEARDLTAHKEAERERRELETQLHRAIKMEAVGRLAGGIAHDFSNLLTSMAGFSEIVLDHLEPGHPLREGAERTLETCQRSAVIIQQILAVSRRQEVPSVVLDLNRQARETVKLVRSLIGEDILVTTLLCGAPLLVRADPGQMEQVLLNLIVNARDAMPAGGRLTVSTDELEPDESQTLSRARLRVSDTGHGMDEKTLAHLFEPFYTTKEKGSGLGLATVYGIVAQSGGSIGVRSRVGEGTTFSIEFPRVANEERAMTRGKPGSAVGRRSIGDETILVVEDDNVVRFVVRETLLRAGYRILEARDGAEALNVLACHDGPLQLLLSDVVLPGMDGPALAERVAQRHPRLKTLYMSGHGQDALVHHGLVPEDGGYLEKPFTRETLTVRVRHILDS